MNKKGFTLTEILIVLVVAGILLALILPNTLKAIERSEVTALRSDLNTVDVALFTCFTEERTWTQCGTLAQLTASGNDYLDLQFVTNNSVNTPFGVTYKVCPDPNGTNANVAGYSGGTNLPTDVTNDTSLPIC